MYGPRRSRAPYALPMDTKDAIYFNNAATTWPKPEEVYAATDRCFRDLTSPMRSALGDRTLQACREEIAAFLGVADPSRLVFTPGCTYSLNMAILGQDFSGGGGLLMSAVEHHAVSRPMRKAAREHGLELHIAPYAPDRPIDLDFVEDKLKAGRVRLVACTMASNVTGDILPSREVVRLAKRYGTPCLIDAAQSAGVLDVHIGEMGADLMTFAGHKGLMGPPGVGVLYAAPHVKLNTLAEGGTGQDSGRHELSGKFPGSFEVGTHNLPAVVGLTAGVRWLAKTTVGAVHAHERRMVDRLLAGIDGLTGVKVHGTRRPGGRTSVASLSFDRHDPKDVGARLASRHNIITRAGYHCAPLAHETIGTLPGPGTLRLSMGYFNTEREVDTVLEALRTELAAG